MLYCDGVDVDSDDRTTGLSGMEAEEWGEECWCSRAEYNFEHTHVESSSGAASSEH